MFQMDILSSFVRLYVMVAYDYSDRRNPSFN